MTVSRLRPAELRTEYRIDPLGVDTAKPRLSWLLHADKPDARGLRQTGYQVLVASTLQRLVSGRADRWDSGEVESAQTAHVEFAGPELGPRAVCHWRVRVRDEAGAWSGWSQPARWTMGALQADFWSARWIGSGDSLDRARPARAVENTLPDLWLRRTFELAAPPVRATAFVASVGFHELYVNGAKVGEGVLTPNVTDNSKRARYVAYEIGPLLHEGRNCVGLWLGTGWSIFSKFVTDDRPRAPIVLGQLDLDLENGEQRRIVTDASWAVRGSPNRLIGAWDFKAFGGEAYDGNQEFPAWSEAGTDDSDWSRAVEFRPKLTVSGDCAEPNQLVTELHALTRSDVAGAARYDLGRNVAGWVELPLEGRPGERAEIRFSERPDRAMTHGLRSEYVLGPSGRGVFRHRFNYAVGRWITVSGLASYPRPRNVRAWLVRPGYPVAADFGCSLARLNDIFRTTMWTFENLTLGGYVVDCPHRERMGYGGDAHATTTTGLSGFGLGAFYTKWAEDWRDVQGRTPTWGIGIPPGQAGSEGHEEGNVPYTAPTYWGGGGPAWSGYCVHLPWEVYRRYGDKRILETNFTTIERWLAFLETKAEGDMLGRYGGTWDFLGDWLWPGAQEVNGDTRETLFFNNCYWIYNLQAAAVIAGIIGRADLQEAWSARAQAVREAVHAEFYQPEEASYVNGFQAYLALALLVELPPRELRAGVWRRLEHEILVVRSGHIHAGITGGTFLFQLLMEARRDDLIFTMVNRDDPPGWGAMLQQGATTFWEAWSEPCDSWLHSSFLFVGAWFVQGVLGLQLDRAVPGFERFTVRPGLVNHPELSWARGHYDSVRGRISIAWHRGAKRYELEVTVPPNTRAQVYLPCTDPDLIQEQDRPLSGRAGIGVPTARHDATVVEVESGAYRFTCPAPRLAGATGVPAP